jgi:hypothetical protein
VALGAGGFAFLKFRDAHSVRECLIAFSTNKFIGGHRSAPDEVVLKPILADREGPASG